MTTQRIFFVDFGVLFQVIGGPFKALEAVICTEHCMPESVIIPIQSPERKVVLCLCFILCWTVRSLQTSGLISPKWERIEAEGKRCKGRFHYWESGSVIDS